MTFGPRAHRGQAGSGAGLRARGRAGIMRARHDGRPMTRTTRYCVLLALALCPLATAVYGAAQMDLARDVFNALRIVDGEAFPLVGPVLTGSFHLGPIWYYALALLLALTGGSWLPTMLAMAALAATQVPLAYLAGKAVYDRRMGMAWAALLVVPGWQTFNSLTPSHPLLAAAAMLAFLLCAARFWRRPRRRYLYGMAVCFALAVHAHPACLALGWVAPIVGLRALKRRECRFVDLAGAAAVVLLPLLPMLYWDASRGFVDLGAARSYAGRIDLAGNLANAWALFEGVAWGGLRYWFGTMLGWPQARVAALLAAFAVLALPSPYGLLRLAAAVRTRALVLLALAVTVAVFLGVAAMRDVTPFYMATPLQVVLAGLLGLGFAGLGAARPAGLVRGAAIAAALAAGCVVAAGCARFQVRGALPFGWLPLFDVKSAPSPTAPLLLMPAYAMDASGRFLCSQPAPSVHGAYAAHVVMNYAIEMRLACGRSDVLAGGDDAGRQHWLGLSRALFARLDVEPERRLGPLGLVPARPLAPARSIPALAQPSYPAYVAPQKPRRELRVQVPLAAGEYLVISDAASMFGDGYEVEARIGGRRLEPEARDRVSVVYGCRACGAGESATVELLLHGGNLDALDFVTFRAGSSPIR
jgi:hypothetical protein